MARDDPDRLLAAEVGKPHGLSGDVFVVPISDDPDRFATGSRLMREDGTTLTVASARMHGNRMLVRFEEAGDRNLAEALRGRLYVSAAEVRPLPEGEFWPHQLIGCSVSGPDGSIGEVAEVIPGTTQDLLRIDGPGGPILIPLVKEIVVDVDVTGRRVVIDPPEGLLDQ